MYSNGWVYIMKILTLIIITSTFMFCQTIEEIIDYSESIAKICGIPPNLLPAVIQIESDFQVDAVSHKEAYGLMQVTYAAYCDFKKY